MHQSTYPLLFHHSFIHPSVSSYNMKRSTRSCRKQFVGRYVTDVVTLYIYIYSVFITSLVHGLNQKDTGRDSSSRIRKCSKSFLFVRNSVAASLYAIMYHLRKPFCGEKNHAHQEIGASLGFELEFAQIYSHGHIMPYHILMLGRLFWKSDPPSLCRDSENLKSNFFSPINEIHHVGPNSKASLSYNPPSTTPSPGQLGDQTHA